MIPCDSQYKSRCTTDFSQSPIVFHSLPLNINLVASLDQKVIKTLCHLSTTIALRLVRTVTVEAWAH